MLAHMISTSRAEPTIGEAERGIVLWLLRALALLRAAQTLPWLTVVFAGRWETYRHPGLVVGLYVGYMCWAVALFARGLARQGFTRGWVAADVALTVGCAYVVGRACMPGYATTWRNWTLGPAMGAAILATISVGPLAGVAAASALSVAWAVAAWQDVAVRPAGRAKCWAALRHWWASPSLPGCSPPGCASRHVRPTRLPQRPSRHTWTKQQPKASSLRWELPSLWSICSARERGAPSSSNANYPKTTMTLSAPRSRQSWRLRTALAAPCSMASTTSVNL